MSNIQPISFEQFAADFVALLDKVRTQQSRIVVEYASGEKLLIQPLAAAPALAEPGADAAPVAGERPSPQRPQDRAPQDQEHNPEHDPEHDPALDTDNISSTGAMYDIDPNSVTPG